MFRYAVHSIIGFVVLLSATAVTLYEGSELVQYAWLWPHTTPVSQLLGLAVPADIHWLDYIVYAAKYVPTYPLVMLVAATYMLIAGIALLHQYKPRASLVAQSLSAGCYLLASILLASAVTTGGKLICMTTLCIGIGLLCSTIVSVRSVRKMTRLHTQ